MVDLSMFSTAVSSLKTAADMAGGLIDIRDAAKLQGKVIELQRQILDAQASTASAHSELLSVFGRVKELENEIAAVRSWEAVAARYRLKDYGGQTFAYELREDAGTGEPLHKLCARCFQDQKKSVLQMVYKSDTQEVYGCRPCDSKIALGQHYTAAPLRRQNRSHFDDL